KDFSGHFTKSNTNIAFLRITPHSNGITIINKFALRTKPLKMKDGSERKFINDGDTVTMRGYAQKGDIRIGFGKVTTKVLPAN
ncbi:MAG: hypothetical protein AAFY00_09115, partial [Bacteroidota bacterium]